MVSRAVAALVTALLVAACGSGSHSTTKSRASASRTAGASTGSVAASSTTTQQTSPSSTASTTVSSSTTTATKTKSAAQHTHTRPPVSTPHFLVKLTIEPGGSLNPPGVAIGGHTIVDLSVSNRSGSAARLEIAHGSQAVFTRTLPTGQTTTKLPALKNATYRLLIDGKPRGTLTIGAKAGP